MKLADLFRSYLAKDRIAEVSATRTGTSTHPEFGSRAAVGDSHAAPEPYLPPLISSWPEEWREVFEERAGIMEFDGDLDRHEAESKAAYWTRCLHRHGQGERFGRPEGRP